MNILQVNIFDGAGGAARVAWSIFDKYRRRGHGSYLAVGKKVGNDRDVFEIPNDAYRNPWAGLWNRVEKKLTGHHIRLLPGPARGFASLGEPYRWLERQRGVEDFNFPGSLRVLSLAPRRPDILHAHVLHSGYHLQGEFVLET